jgi:hypothetical protein
MLFLTINYILETVKLWTGHQMPENKLFCSWSLLFSQSFQSAQQVSRQNLLLLNIFDQPLFGYGCAPCISK